MRVKIGGNVQRAKLINKVDPVYPNQARANGIHGTVRLHVIVAQNGSIRQIAVVSGDAALVQTTLDAVKPWRYRPTLLNGQPVEVDSEVDVIFALKP